MKLKVDEKSDALYLRLNEASIEESEEVEPGVILDYDRRGHVVGIEILGIRKRAGKKANLNEVVFQKL